MPGTDTTTAGLGRADLKRLLRQAREAPVHAAFALGGDGKAILSLDKRKPPRTLERGLKDEAPDSRMHRFGSVAASRDEPKLAIFTVNKAAPGMARKLVLALKGTGFNRVRVMLEDGTVAEAAEGEEEEAGDDALDGPAAAGGAAAHPVPPPEGSGSGVPVQPDAAALRAELTDLVKRIPSLLLQAPSLKDSLLQLATGAQASLKARDAPAAAAGVNALRQAMDGSGSFGGIAGPGLVEESGAPPTPVFDDAAPREAEPLPGGTGGFMLASYSPDDELADASGSAGAKAPGKHGAGKAGYVRYQVRVPMDCTTLPQMYRLFERWVYQEDRNFRWDCGGYCDMERNRGKVVPFLIAAGDVEARTSPAVKQALDGRKRAYGGLPGPQKAVVKAEADRRYVEQTGEPQGTAGRQDGSGEARMWDHALGGVMADREVLQTLPPQVRDLMLGKDGSFKPRDYAQLRRIAGKLAQFTPDDVAVWKLLPVRATDDLGLFEKAVDTFLASRAQAQPAPQAGATGPHDPMAVAWKDFDPGAIAGMSEADRYDLARQKTDEATAAQLRHMADNPGSTLKDFAKSATLLNTPETLGAIGKDISEAGTGDANAWARFGAGAGAGAKLSGWLMAAAGIVYVASWATGVGELATIGAGAAILLGSTLTLSLAESELRIKAASQAKTPEEFKRNVEAAAAARANVIMAVALIIAAAVLHFTAKALFPKAVEDLNTSLKNIRERIRLKGSIAELKPGIIKELSARKADLLQASARAKDGALAAAKELEGLDTDGFVARLERGGDGFLDQSKLPAEQKVDFRELLKSPEGRKAVEGYRQRLVVALHADVPAQIEALAREHVAKVDDMVAEVEKARNHDELQAAAAKLDGVLGEAHAKAFVAGEQDKLIHRKMEEAAGEAQREVVQGPAASLLNYRSALQRGSLGDAAQALGRLDTEAQITELGKLTPEVLKNLHQAAATRFGPNSKEARLSDPAHRTDVETDPAVNRSRPTERDTALRVEQKLGVRLRRYMPQVGQKGDWVDAKGVIYDGCSPGPARFFDENLRNGNYERSLRDHLGHPTVDRVVVDISNLGYSPQQIQALNQLIGRVAGSGNPKIVRIP